MVVVRHPNRTMTPGLLTLQPPLTIYQKENTATKEFVAKNTRGFQFFSLGAVMAEGPCPLSFN